MPYFRFVALAFTAAVLVVPPASAEPSSSGSPVSFAPSGNTSTPPFSSRYGLFGLLDHRSSYGQDVFPEPFLIDDSDLEPNEFRLDWFHAKAGIARSDAAKVELEKGVGPVTLEIEAPYERDASPDGVIEGVGNIALGARVAVYQYVSSNNFFDTTFGVGVEVGIPTTSAISKNAEFVPKVLNDTRFGDHLTVQSVFGYSTVYGPGDDAGLRVFEYGALVGITIHHTELPIPGVEQLIPLFEMSGKKQLNHDEKGVNTLLGNVGFRVNLKTIGPIEPRVGLGWVFPLNEAARSEVHAGIYTSLVFEY